MPAQNAVMDDNQCQSVSTCSSYPDSRRRRTLRSRAISWFSKNQRKMPWRSRISLYRTWVSEIMLQQTQVATVIDYFNRFMKAFPTIRALAEADQQKVLSLWEGLGYYRRARSLHQAARQICEFHGGEFPKSFDQVIRLPGIGRYTAGAILSIADGQALPILEGNTYRLHARLLGLLEDPKEKEPEKLLWQFATDLLPTNRSGQHPGQLNQALMELGSEICKPLHPRCDACPLRTQCVTHQMGLENEIPVASAKTRYEKLHQALVLLENSQGDILVRQRQENEWWSGLWDFVRVDLTAADCKTTFLKETIETQTGTEVHLPTGPDLVIRHAVTRYRIQLDCYHLKTDFRNRPKEDYLARQRAEIRQLPLNVTARKLFRALEPD
ncbi:MAG: A/G-specific adenine glycosylase [Planctomycetota bacterium]|nr:A/G-specific adenine glycosylase [Planctomycetota bacterium]